MAGEGDAGGADRPVAQPGGGLRLGKVNRLGGGRFVGDRLQKPFRSRAILDGIDLGSTLADGSVNLPPEQVRDSGGLPDRWPAIEPHHVALDLRQKGVDLRIRLDIASLTLKGPASTIVLIAGDIDVVPALYEPIDGLEGGLPKPRDTAPAAQDFRKTNLA